MIPQPAGETEASGIGVDGTPPPSPGITTCADTVVWTPGLCDRKRTQSAFSNNSVHDCDGTKR